MPLQVKNCSDKEESMSHRESGRLPTTLLAALAAASICLGSAAAAGAANNAPSTFGSPDEAVKALVAAAKSDDIDAIVRILGADTREWLLSGDPALDEQVRQRFVTAFEQKSALETQSSDKVALSVGNDGFPFPFPLVQKSGRWSFDAAAGKEELLNRWVGRDEINTIQTLLAIVDAQREYASMGAGPGRVPQYAQKFRSSPGKMDGLYWPAEPGQKESPLGPLLADAVKAGYRAPAADAGPVPYQGYYFRILTGQGEHAAGGAYDYVVKGKMIGGFAVVAYPAKYGVSGVKTFMVNQDGVVYEADLGPQTAKAAEKLQKFDPSSNWSKEAAAN
jgi:hypothetical protein